MPTDKNKIVKSNRDILHLFPQALGQDILIKKNAELEDTMNLLAEKLPETLHETKLIARQLQGESQYESCRNVWNFVYQYVAYVRDEKKKEQIKAPSRTLSDQKGDCDDMSLLCASILKNMGIRVLFRIAHYWYDKPEVYSHIYVVAITDVGEIIIDCVNNRFNYEEPYVMIKDRNMDLYYLNGIEKPSTVDVDDLTNGGFDELGKIKIFQKIGQAVKNTAQKVGNAVKTAAEKVGDAAKVALNAVNKVNPATALLRLGVLGAMKLNMMGVAERLRFGYLSEAEARKRGFNMDKWGNLKKALEKIEGIFYGAGGKKENLKEAILTGKGNESKEVSGLDPYAYDTPLREVIGSELYSSEVNGLEGLGEPVTAAALASATTVIATIAAILKKIGSLKDGNAAPEAATPVTDPGAVTINPEVSIPKDFQLPPDLLAMDDAQIPMTKSEAAKTLIPRTNIKLTEAFRTATTNVPATQPTTSNLPAPTGTGENTGSNVTKNTGTGENKDNETEEKKWYQKPVVIGAIAVGTVAAGILVYKLTRPKPTPTKPKDGEALSGTWTHPKGGKRNKNKKKNKGKSNYQGKQEIKPIKW